MAAFADSVGNFTDRRAKLPQRIDRADFGGSRHSVKKEATKQKLRIFCLGGADHQCFNDQ